MSFPCYPLVMSLFALLAVLYLHVDGIAHKPSAFSHRILQSEWSGAFLERQSAIQHASKGAAKNLTQTNLALLRALASADVVDVHYDPETQDILNVTSIPAVLSSQEALHTPYSVESLRDGIKGLRAYFSSTANSQGDSRSIRMLQACKELGIKCTRLIPVERGSKDIQLNAKLMFALRTFLDSDPSDLAMFVEDDATFIKDFGMNLRQSVMELPNAWTVFHLGSGFLHDRRHHSASFDLTLEGPLEGNPRTGAGGRIFFDWPHAAKPSCCGNENGVLAGGPVGMLLKKDGARQIHKVFAEEPRSNASRPDDVVLRNIGVDNPGTHFIARQPQLCIEHF